MKAKVLIKKNRLYGQEEEFQILFENVPAIIALINKYYRLMRANRSFYNIFGNQIGKYCYQAFKSSTQKCSPCPAEITFREGSIQVSEQVGYSKEKKEIYYLVYCAPIHNKQGKIQYVLEMAIDLTERKILEKNLQRNWCFLRNIIDHSPCAILAINEQEEITVFNRLAEQILGYLPAEIRSLNELENIFPLKIFSTIKTLLANKSWPHSPFPLYQESWLRSKTGEKIPVRLSLVPFTQEEPAHKGMVVLIFFEDLRPLKILEQKKIQAEKMAAIGHTIAGLAHGIKNIVTGLEGGAYVVQSALRKKDEALLEKGWQMVERNVGKISTLTKDLLNYSRPRPLDLRWVNLEELIQDVYSLYQNKAEKEGIEISIDCRLKKESVYLDPKGIHTCLTNLISNALDACRLDSSKEIHRVIIRVFCPSENTVVLEVEDNGIGISAEDQKKIFQSFFTTKGTTGTGLGLLITQKIVQEHGGTISFNTTPGKGSIFRIILPQESKES